MLGRDAGIDRILLEHVLRAPLATALLEEARIGLLVAAFAALSAWLPTVICKVGERGSSRRLFKTDFDVAPSRRCGHNCCR